MNKNTDNNTAKALAAMQEVVETLLDPSGGCPWDKEQTPFTLCDYLCEEVFELTDAVRRKNSEDACEEMGDVLFILLFMAQLFSNEKSFALKDAFFTGAEKMIRRHPHVFASEVVSSKAELMANWERIKKEESSTKPVKATPFDSVPASLPPLLKSYRIHSKAEKAGFTWQNTNDVLAQIKDEWKEWDEAVSANNKEAMEEEFGDILFTLVEFGRRHGIKASAALDNANLKFLHRYEKMLELAKSGGLDFSMLSLDEKNELWKRVK